MSIAVVLHRLKLDVKDIGSVTLIFRGESRTSTHHTFQQEYVHIHQRFMWKLHAPILKGEGMCFQLHSNKSKGCKYIAGYMLGMEILIQLGKVAITDYFIAPGNIALPAYLEIDVNYKEPIVKMPKRFNLTPASTDNASGSADQTSIEMEEASGPLDAIERNIANVERSMIEERKNKEEHKVDIEEDEDDNSALLPKRSGFGIFKFRGGFSLKAIDLFRPTRRRSTLRTMRDFIRNGRSQPDSGDEEAALIHNASVGSDPGNESSAESLDEEIDGEDRISKYQTSRRRKIFDIDFGGPPIQKPADYQLCVTIYEGRHLAGYNTDPVVSIHVGDQRKCTSVKESTNSPYYNEYFVFDFHELESTLLEKVICIKVQHSRNFFRGNKFVGIFKIDLSTIWNQPGHQFYHKWAVLTDPDDFMSGPKGYLKCDISLMGKGDIMNIPPRRQPDDDDDIEANLLMPCGMAVDRQRVRLIIMVYKADGLPNMNFSIVANMKKAIGNVQEQVDPLVQVHYAGMNASTSVKKSSSSPVWNEQIIFTDMFPPLCQRLKIIVKDSNTVTPNVIGTHYIDLRTISNDGDKGFLPTFGPSYINIYGSSRMYNLADQYLNTGMGEGIAYRGRLLLEIRSEILDSNENHPSLITSDLIPEVEEVTDDKNEHFFLFGGIFNADMIDKSLVEKPISFELSMGNAGNSIDGMRDSVKNPQTIFAPNLDTLPVDQGYWYNQTTILPLTAVSTDKVYYYMPFENQKPVIQVRTIWPDHRHRMFNSNRISKIIDLYEDALSDTQALVDLETEPDEAVAALKRSLDIVSRACIDYVNYMTKQSHSGQTKLDFERHHMCIRDIGTLSSATRTMKSMVTKHSIKDKLRTAYVYLKKLKDLCEDPQHGLPDVFIWLVSNDKRLAYGRIPARYILYSNKIEERGKYCGENQTIFLKWPGKKNQNWNLPAKMNVNLWLGVLNEKIHFIDGIPKGYEIKTNLKSLDVNLADAPSYLEYTTCNYFELRAYIYQARSLIGSDASGLSDPFARIIINEFSASTQVIDETLSPTWDELLVIANIPLYSTVDHIKNLPPTIIIEIYDRDNVGKAEFIGRALARPSVKAFDEPYDKPLFPPSLEWHDIKRGDNRAGELLAAFELLQIPPKDSGLELPQITKPKTALDTLEVEIKPTDALTILPVPDGIRPTLSKYRIEVLFWGVRELKRIHFLNVERPRVDVECASHILSSTVIYNSRRNPNFTNAIKFIDLELPDQEMYRPPLTIRVVDCRSFGRVTLVGTHTINSIQKYIYTPLTKEQKLAEQWKKSYIPLENIDLKSNTILQTDGVIIENEKENCPLLKKSERAQRSYNTGTIPKKPLMKLDFHKNKNKKLEDEFIIDWWTKYFASLDYAGESIIKDYNKRPVESVANNNFARQVEPIASTSSYWPVEPVPSTSSEYREVTSPKHDKDLVKKGKSELNKSLTPEKKIIVPKSASAKIYPRELEAVEGFDGFKEWLQPFELYRGKNTGEDTLDENRLVGVFKGAVKAYKLPLINKMEEYTVMGFDPKNGFFQGIPNNDPVHVLVRVYIVKAEGLHPMDINGKADPYIVLHCGSQKISDKDNYVSKQLNPTFGKCFEIEAVFPRDSQLTVQVLDWDLVGSDDLIGETKIDLENRYYSRHRATCGLPTIYNEQGYNRWRDAMKPIQILNKLCKDGRLDPPQIEFGMVKVGHTLFTIPMDNQELFGDTDDYREQMALIVLHRWHEVPRIGTRLVPEHIESRPLYKASKPGVEQGRLEMWVEMFPMDAPLPGPPMDITPRKPTQYELRVIIWNTDDVVLEDDAFFSGEKMSDIYVKGWLTGPNDCQATDVHYRSLTGEGNFNWRFIYPFYYVDAEERIVKFQKESVFSWDETESKMPPRLILQVWDADHFTKDDFLGAISLDLNSFPRGAKTSKLCTLQMLRNDREVPMINIFKQKRAKGWWPFYIKKENDELELTGKVEAELQLFTRDEADRIPAGLGRGEPDPLERPMRPDGSFLWFLNPLKSMRYVLWHNYKWTILKGAGVVIITIFFLLFFFAIPDQIIQKIMHNENNG